MRVQVGSLQLQNIPTMSGICVRLVYHVHRLAIEMNSSLVFWAMSRAIGIPSGATAVLAAGTDVAQHVAFAADSAMADVVNNTFNAAAGVYRTPPVARQTRKAR